MTLRSGRREGAGPVGRLLRRIGRYVRPEPPATVRRIPEWSIAIASGRTLTTLTVPAGSPVLARQHVHDVPAAFVADPFMIRGSNGWYLFFEVFNTAGRKGEIGLARSVDGGSWVYDRIVLAEPFHLSYPHVFSRDDDVFMIPETHQTCSIRLYRAADFPLRWTLVTTLLRGRAWVDPTIFRARGCWWLFVSSGAGPAMADSLHLYHADRLEGPWQEHRLSPVVANDRSRVRPAGRVVVEGDAIFRFTQDCSGEYGRSVAAFEVVELSKRNYVERPAGIGPVLSGSGSGWNAAGMHHIDAHRDSDGGWIACVDGHRWRTVPVQTAGDRGNPG